MKFEPYLTFGGNCEEAMNFYREIFDGEFTVLWRYGEAPPPISEKTEIADKIMHMTMRFGECELMASDRMDIKVTKGNTNSLSIKLKDNTKASAIYGKLAADGQVEFPFDAVFWGGKFGSLVDKYGIQWMISSNT